MFVDSVYQKLGKGSVGMPSLCSTMSGASTGKTQSLGVTICGWNHLKARSFLCLVVNASCQLRPQLGL